MLRSPLLAGILMTLAAIGPLSAQTPPLRAGGDLGQEKGPCLEDAQVVVDRGFSLLHSFQYEWARGEFQEATELDPACAMAWCGEALTYNHALWEPPTREEIGLAQAALAKARLAARVTLQQRRFIGAVNLLFENHRSVPKPGRDEAFHEEMARIHKENPTEVEFAAWYGLSFLALDGAPKEKRDWRLQVDKVLWIYFDASPDHPGVLNYLIHALETTPQGAQRALPVARGYPAIAPDVPHALSMPAHIYGRLGMWNDALEATLAADRATEALNQRMGWPADRRDLRNTEWRLHAYVQLGRLMEAKTFLASLKELALETFDADTISTYTRLRYRYLLEGRRWEEALRAEPLSRSTEESSWLAHSRALAGAFTGDRDAAERGLDFVRSARRDSVQALEAEAAYAMMRGDTGEMIRIMEEVVSREDPALALLLPPIPAYELFGEMLLQVGNPKRAAKEFQRSLVLRPNRPRSLFGLAKATVARGDETAARAAVNDVMAIWVGADDDFAPRDEAQGMRRSLEDAP